MAHLFLTFHVHTKHWKEKLFSLHSFILQRRQTYDDITTLTKILSSRFPEIGRRKTIYLFKIIDLLLEAGADVNRVDQNNRTALDLAYLYMIEQVNDKKEDTKRELIELLTYYGAKRASDL